MADISEKSRDDIQALRGIAVLFVVLFHLQVPYFRNGFVGVDIFFVISGYLMARLHEGRTVGEFYRRRADRLFGCYAATIGVTLLAGYLIALPVDFQQLFEQAVAAVFAVSNVFYWNQNSYFDKTAFNPLLHLWSLGVEIQFYLLVPFLYPLLRRNKALFAAAFLISFVGSVAVQTISPKTAFFLLPFRLWEFLVGAWIAWHVAGAPARTASRAPVRIGLLAVLVFAPLAVPLRPEESGSILFGHPSLFALGVTAATGAILAAGLPEGPRWRAVFAPLRKLGDYSYSIYLVHFPAIVLLNYEPFGGTRLRFDDAGALAFALVAVAAGAWAMHRWIDGAWRGVFRATAAKFGILGVCLIAAVALNERGWAAYPDVSRNILLAWTDRDAYRCGKLFRILNPTESLCPLDGIGGDRRVLLLGNSHADSIKKVFAETARDAGLAAYFAVPNDPLMGGDLTAARTMSLVEKHRIGAIVLHFSDVYRDATIAAEIAALIRAAARANVPTALIGPVPTYGAHVPKAMFANPTSPAFPVKITPTEHRRRTAAYIEFARAMEREGAATFDPAPVLCPDAGPCRYADEAFRPYYFDDGHLTLTGSALLRPLFEETMRRFR